jgi:putative ubiquitin-RnfH superfamily antitoxin RatB of RatAB toxin-antitoxin module
MSEQIMIEVSYALPDKQIIIPVLVTEGISVKEAIELSGILTKFEGIDLSINLIGIFGKLTTLDKTLRNHDRIEIYRPLSADPMEIRRKRVAESKEMKKSN